MKVEFTERGWIRLPKDADGEYWHIGDMSEEGEIVGIKLFGEFMSLIFRHGNGYRNERTPNAIRHATPDTAESIVHELAIGSITEEQAIRRLCTL